MLDTYKQLSFILLVAVIVSCSSSDEKSLTAIEKRLIGSWQDKGNSQIIFKQDGSLFDPNNILKTSDRCYWDLSLYEPTEVVTLIIRDGAKSKSYILKLRKNQLYLEVKNKKRLNLRRIKNSK